MQVLASMLKAKITPNETLADATARAEEILEYYASKKQFANALVGVGKRQLKAQEESAAADP